MKESLLEKVKGFDRNGEVKIEIDSAMKSLREFRIKYPFAENPKLIETLDPNDIFTQRNGVGDFFVWVEYHLKTIGHLKLYGSNVYRQIRDQLEDFKELLYAAVDPQKTLAQKVDAPWERIRGLGQDKHIAKKIIFCFNYENGDSFPIFSTNHLEYFLSEIAESLSIPAQYSSRGEMYESLIYELFKVKQNLLETQLWEPTYFARFLYDSYPPLQMDEPKRTSRNPKLNDETRNEQIQFAELTKLLNELRKKEKISGEEYRNYGKSWRERPQERETIIERLRILMAKSA